MNPWSIVKAGLRALVAGSREARATYREVVLRQQAELRRMREETLAKAETEPAPRDKPYREAP